MDTMNTMKVSDHALVATLIYLNIPSRGTEKLPESRRVNFLFEVNNELGVIIESFYNGELRVDPRKFAPCMKEIKTRINQQYPELQNGGTYGN